MWHGLEPDKMPDNTYTPDFQKKNTERAQLLYQSEKGITSVPE